MGRLERLAGRGPARRRWDAATRVPAAPPMVMRGASVAGRAGTMICLRRRRGAFVGTPPRVNRLPACPRAWIESGRPEDRPRRAKYGARRAMTRLRRARTFPRSANAGWCPAGRRITAPTGSAPRSGLHERRLPRGCQGAAKRSLPPDRVTGAGRTMKQTAGRCKQNARPRWVRRRAGRAQVGPIGRLIGVSRLSIRDYLRRSTTTRDVRWGVRQWINSVVSGSFGCRWIVRLKTVPARST